MNDRAESEKTAMNQKPESSFNHGFVFTQLFVTEPPWASDSIFKRDVRIRRERISKFLLTFGIQNDEARIENLKTWHSIIKIFFLVLWSQGRTSSYFHEDAGKNVLNYMFE